MITDNRAKHRFEMKVDGYTAFLVYRPAGDALALVHTEVPEPVAGRGVGTELVREVLAELKARHVHVVPVCPFVREYVERHPDSI